MKTALEFYKSVPMNMPKIVREMQKWLFDLPDRNIESDDKGLWSCHALTRAAKLKWRLDRWRIADGFFCGTYQHSWLVRDQDQWHMKLILDVCPVASIGGSILYDALSSLDKNYEEKTDFYGVAHFIQWQKDADLILALSKKM